ncbi:alpha amylase [Coprinopsis marcescibilis]|uniref:Alpha-amylase n=1 Tax=Coprinopsis marcescibilis TaxID=230819 RepID=A0A5C3KPC1_COPMA|nr:alpha amylase [Coprinopsis marcescibilis]
MMFPLVKSTSFWALVLPLVGFASVFSVANPLEHQLVKRAPQVSLINQSYSNNVLSGSLNVQNIAYSKVVTVHYAVGNSWAESQVISASYVSSGSNNFETWSFSGSATGATQFYIRYQVSGQSYYDPGNNANHQIVGTSPPPASSSTPATSLTPGPEPSVPGSTSSIPPGPTVAPGNLPAILPSNVPFEAPATPPTGCNNFNGGDNCASGSDEIAASAERRRWQTPPRGDAAYVESFQDYSHLVGYANIQYSSGRNSAVVTVNAAHKDGATLSYTFDGQEQSSPIFQVSSSRTTDLPITITSSDGKQLVLEPINFFWQHQSLSAAQSTFNNGQKGGIAELFGWPWNDVAKECEFLGKAGYMGVKVWSPNEHVWGSHYYETDSQFRPWYLVYQPVSYRLQSRSGTRAELRNMINACRRAGVRVYADAVVNHMSGQGTDIQNHRVGNCQLYSGHNATANSPYYTSGNTFLINPFTNTRPTLEFPAVPYGPTDFHCERSLSSWTDGHLITRGWLVGLTDLNTEKAYVQDRIATYLVDLLSIGFSGFRIDAAKHIGPASTAAILGRVKDKMGGSLPADFITWLEIIMGGEASLLACDGGEWSWYTNLDNKLAAAGISSQDIQKVKIWSSDYPKEMPICGRWILPASRFAIQNDDHDQQNDGSSSRDMGSQGSVLIKEKNVGTHRGHVVNLFARRDNDWHIKLLLSSYMFASNGGSGFPDGLSDCSKHYTGTQGLSGCRGIEYDQAYVANACAYTMVPGKYTRPHRDLSIINAMRGWAGLGQTNAGALGISGCS